MLRTSPSGPRSAPACQGAGNSRDAALSHQSEARQLDAASERS